MYAGSTAFVGNFASTFPERTALAELFEILHTSLLQRDFHKAASTLSVLVYRFNHSPELILRACVEMLRTEVLEPSRHRTVVLRFFRILLATKRKALFSTALVEMVRFFLSRNDFEDARHTLVEYSRVPRFAASAALIASLQGLVDFTQWKMVTNGQSIAIEERGGEGDLMDTTKDDIPPNSARKPSTGTEGSLLATPNASRVSITELSFLGDEDDSDSEDDFVSTRSRTAPSASMNAQTDSVSKLRESSVRFFLTSFKQNPNGLDAAHLVHLFLAGGEVEEAKNVMSTWRSLDGSNPTLYCLLLRVLRQYSDGDIVARWDAARQLLALDPISSCALHEIKEMYSRGALTVDQCRVALQPSLDYLHLFQDNEAKCFVQSLCPD